VPRLAPPPARRGREVIQRPARAGQLQLDRRHPGGVADEAVQAELDREQRPAQLMARAGDEHEAQVRPQGVGDEGQRQAPAAERDDHGVAPEAGPSTSR
jgi:hypothetical protein